VSISTHVLDTVSGQPARGLHVALEAAATDGKWQLVAQGITDSGGRVADLLFRAGSAGSHRIVFDTGAWSAAQGRESFYPRVTVEFAVIEPAAHHHIPLLVSPYGYTTYRGS